MGLTKQYVLLFFQSFCKMFFFFNIYPCVVENRRRERGARPVDIFVSEGVYESTTRERLGTEPILHANRCSAVNTALIPRRSLWTLRCMCACVSECRRITQNRCRVSYSHCRLFDSCACVHCVFTYLSQGHCWFRSRLRRFLYL